VINTVVTVKGYDTVTSDEWSSIIKINVKDECIKRKGNSLYVSYVFMYSANCLIGHSTGGLHINSK